VLSLQREEEDGREVVHLCNARFPSTDRLKKVDPSKSCKHIGG
jgi:hypothetical protein